MERGRAAAHAGQPDRAQRYLAAVLEIDPSNEEALLELAAVAQDPQEALAYVAQVLTLNPGNEQARQELRALRQSAGNLPAYEEIAPPALAEPWSQRLLSKKGWIALFVAGMILLAALSRWSDAPRTVVAALLPTDTLTPTFTPTPTPTYTPTPTFTPTATTTPTTPATPTTTPTLMPTPTASNTPTPEQDPTEVPADKSESEKWIEVDLSKQRLCAHEGQETVFCAPVSTGTKRYPTVKGRFKIYAKYRSTRMQGRGYDLPKVPWTMYFHGNYAIHGTYWHSNFGTPMSHGCINMKTPQARRLFQWAPKGTLVVVHR
jgi:lipoprotein-anchoring transpeptidase ErfK/SrfK